MFSVILHDWSRGWVPNGTVTTLVIDEIEVNCNEAPADGTTLKYVVINRDPIVH